MDKVKSNIAAISISIILVLITLFSFNDNLIKFIKSSSKDAPLALTKELENGVITIFGSSELGQISHEFIPINFFKNKFDIEVKHQGIGHHQSFVIFSQLASYYNEKVKNNARIVIFLSPGWFETEGTNIEIFLKYMTPNMLEKIFFDNNIDDRFKLWTSEYLSFQKLISINNINLPIYYAATYKYWNFFKSNSVNEIATTSNSTTSHKIKSDIDWDLYRNQAAAIEKKRSTNNSILINDEYYSRYIKKYADNGSLPFPTEQIKSPQNNQEYQDFLKLVELCKKLKIKPLFIMQDLNPYAYKNLENYNEILTEIKSTLVTNDFPYLDMWSWKGKSEYQPGKLTDIMHTGELGWVDVDQFIYEHFVGDNND